MDCPGARSKNASFHPVNNKPKQNSGLDIELTEGNQKAMESSSPTALQVESSVQSQKREKHATLRRSRSDTSYGFEVQRNSDSTEENQKVLASFASAALETEASLQSQTREKHATPRRSRSNVSYSFGVQRNFDSSEGYQKVMENLSLTLPEVESSAGSQKQEEHTTLRRSRSDTSYRFEVQRHPDSTEGNQKAMESFPPTAVKVESLVGSPERENHATLRRSKSDTSYRFEVQRHPDSTEGNQKAMEIFPPTAVKVESSAGSSKRENHATLRRSRSDTSYRFEVQRHPDSTEGNQKAMESFPPTAVKVESSVGSPKRENHATLRRSRSDTSYRFEVQRHPDSTEGNQKAMESFPPTAVKVESSVGSPKRENHATLRRSRSDTSYRFEVQRHPDSTEGNQKAMESFPPTAVKVESSVGSPKRENHATLRRSRSDTSYRFEVQRHPDSTEGNQKAMESFPPTAVKVESSVGSPKRENHATLRRSRSDTSYRFEVQRHPDSTEGNQKAVESFPPTVVKVGTSIGSQKRENHATLRRLRSDTSYSSEVQRNSDLTERIQKAMASFPPTTFKTNASCRSPKGEKHATLRRSRSSAHYGSEVRRNTNSTEGNQKAMESFPRTTFKTNASFRSQKREKHATLPRSMSNANYGSEVPRNSKSTEGNQKAMDSFSPATLQDEWSVRSQKGKNHASLRSSKSDTSYGFEVQRNSDSTEGNENAMVSFPPAALELEGSVRS